MEELTSGDPRWIGESPRYQVLARLGSGGMGRVYLGKSPTAERVAIKVILAHLVSNDSVRKRFEAEVANLKLAQGIRVAQFRGARISQDQPWLAVEYVPGRSLREHVDDRGVLDVRATAALGAMLAEGLATIHDAGLLHRDLKPANIMLGPDGPRIIDLGLAVLQERDEHLTQTGFAVGTVAYMSPEQAAGAQDLTPAVDVYALGATLLFAATRHQPYPKVTPVVLAGWLTDPDRHPDLSGLPKELESLVGPMLAFDPQSRPTVPEVLTDLTRIATADGVDFEVVRHKLVEQTYVAPPPIPSPPKDLDDPVVEHDEWSAGPTELVSTPPPPTRPEPPTETSVAETPEAPRIDLGWLTERLRRQYARRATL